VAKYRVFRLLLVLPLIVSSCSSQSDTLCDSALSIPSFTMRFTQGLDNFSEDQYEQLRLDTLDALETVNDVAVLSDSPEEASRLAIKINNFIATMDDVDWDVSIALLTNEAVQAASVLGTSETLAQANAIDAFVISQCGLPSTLAPVAGSADSLPSPSIPSPTQTDPPASPPNESSENREEGRLVAGIFDLSLTDSELDCLGAELANIVDVSGANANLAQYQGQFQKAFDSCAIDFKVPVE